MYLYDYQTIKLDHQERIEQAAQRRVVKEVHREARMARMDSHRSTRQRLVATMTAPIRRIRRVSLRSGMPAQA